MTQTLAVNFDGRTMAQTYVRVVRLTPGDGVPIRFSKMLAAASGGLLAWDAWSDSEEGENWYNTMSIWGRKSGLDWIQLFNFGNGISAPYASKAAAYSALAAFFPQTYTEYDDYEIRLTQDGGVGSGGDLDNQGGVSILVEYLNNEVAYDRLLTQIPDAPIKEEWKWQTDTQVSFAGNEDRTPINVAAKRTFSGNYSFETVKDIRAYKRLLQRGSRGVFKVALFQYQLNTKTPIEPFQNYIFCNTARGDFREGCEALIREGDRSELVVIGTVLPDRLALGVPPRQAYSQRALICPITKVYTATGATVNRVNPDHSGTADFDFREYLPWLPFVNPLQDVDLTVFDTMFVLDNRAIGTQFTEQFDSGLLIEDEFIGRPVLSTPWTQGQWAFPLRWQCNRVWDIDSWFWWQRFADAVQGSSLAFLLPSFRSDLAVTTPALGGGNVITFTGHDFRDHYYGLDTFARLVIESATGRQFVKVTGITNVGGNDRVTFSPALSAGDWSIDQKVGFLLKVRNVDDKVTVDHYGLHADISMSVRTVK